jgi:hypothetical protein
VVRKRGEFVPFRVPAVEVIRSGKRRHRMAFFSMANRRTKLLETADGVMQKKAG